MNVVFLSPHFPVNHLHYCARLKERGVNVLGLADEPWERLSPEQQSAMTEYYRVERMEDYEAVRRALGWFVHRHGRIDRIESHAEYWMRTEARLRADFNVPGRRESELDRIQRKSAMKERFVAAGVPVSPGRRIGTFTETLAFMEEVGGPFVAKPDVGVGALGTYRVDTTDDLDQVLAVISDQEYFLEKYIDGMIVTFDGLVDAEGRILFAGSMEYSIGVMEAVNEERDLYYFTHRTMPPELEELGRRALRGFDVRDGFFHFEFFRRPDGSHLALEANLRPPGAWSIDMMNYGAEVDLYAEWANLVAGREVRIRLDRPFYCCYAGRKQNLPHRLTHEEILARYGGLIVFHTPVPPLFRGGMGDYAYLFRTPDLEEVHAVARAIQES